MDEAFTERNLYSQGYYRSLRTQPFKPIGCTSDPDVLFGLLAFSKDVFVNLEYYQAKFGPDVEIQFPFFF